MKSDYKIIAIVVIVSVVLFGGLIWLMNSSQVPQNIDMAYLIGSDPHSKGASEEDAVLTIVEFSDFQCPACRSSDPVVAQFLKDHPNEVRLVYRHFPLVTLHPNAQRAAIASEIASSEGFFWEYHDLLFENQDAWAEESNRDDLFASYAQELGMDPTDFKEKLDVDTYMLEVREDQNVALDLNLNSTPTYFFNGKIFKGVPTLNDFVDQLSEAQNAQ